MNILDYLDWRGDLSFAASPPNEVDALFGILEGTGAVRTTELPEKLVQNGFWNLIHSPEDRERKKIVLHVLLKLIKAGNSNLYESVRHSETVKEIMGRSEKQRRLS